MGEIVMTVGILLMCAAVGVSNFFKLILWAGACVALYYGMEMVGLLDGEASIAFALLIIGVIQISASTFVIKVFGIEIARGVSDVIIHALGIIMLIASFICFAIPC